MRASEFKSKSPGYIDLIYDAVETFKWYHSDEERNANYTNLFDEFARICNMSLDELNQIVTIGIIFTIVRYLFEKFICKPLLRNINMNDKTQAKKLPESIWKTTAYLGLWLYCAYMLTIKYDYFLKPFEIWDDWEKGMTVPADIKLLYFVECGFYFHSVYATIYMDSKRKDFMVLLMHHFLTMALMLVSYAARYHKIGILVLFVHDVTDILLEFTKINAYIKNRNGKFYYLNELISNIGFVAFTASWILFRLYWFPLKILYSTGVVGIRTSPNLGLYGFFNILLWILQFLNIYWFYFIVIFLKKIATGQLKELADTREYEDDETETTEKKKAQ